MTIGKITDANSGKPLSGIMVSVINNTTGSPTGLGDQSDANGEFVITDDPYADGDTSVFIRFDDPSGKYNESVYPHQGLDGMSVEMYPAESPVPLWVKIVGALAIAFVIYLFIKYYKK